MICSHRTTCRLCGGNRLRRFLSLGPSPLANSFLHSPAEFEAEPFYPLDVFFCETCSLVQLLDVIDPEVLFRHYIYVTGTSETMVAHLAQYASTLVDLLKLTSTDLVIEVASNDGSFLRHFRHYGVRTLGVEPATNIAEMARAAGIETVCEFFNSSAAERIRKSHGLAKVVTANNVLAHVDNTPDFLRGCRSLLEPDGLAVIEVPYLREFLDRLEYDTVTHEHLCYFSVTTLLRLCDVAGLSIVRMDRVPIHGGSLRLYAGLPERHGGHAQHVVAWAEEERRAGLSEYGRYEQFARDVEYNRREILDLLEALRREGKTVAGYGAPAKGNTLLNYCGIDTRLLPYTVDRNPLKVGLYTPGAHIPVLPPEALVERQPDYVVILVWNLAEEVMRQQQEYRSRGGRFIIPIPQPQVI